MTVRQSDVLSNPKANDVLRTIGHFIGGRHVTVDSRSAGDVWEPSTGELRARVLFADSGTVDEAVRRCASAFPTWAQTPAARRAQVLFAFRHRLLNEIDRLAEVITSEHGKTIEDARGEIMRGIEVVEFACGIPHLLKGEFTENAGRDVDSWSVRQALGVVVGITPFNFPAMVPMWMFPIAIACGNTFILKPSEKDPSLALEMAQMLFECGLPADVLNVVNGDRSTVERLTQHPDVAAVSFVGSSAVAEQIYTNAAASFKRVQALGSAKNHLVALPDAPLAQLADAAIGSAFGSAGERCMAISVVVAVGDEIADHLIAELVPRLNDMKVGPGNAPGVEMGPLITREHRDRVASYIDLAEQEGAKIVVDGRGRPHPKGFFVGPTLLDRVQPHMRVYREEIFGPVLSLVRVGNLRDALDVVNAHQFGNGAAIFTQSGEASRWFSLNVHVGMVGINVPIPVPMSYHSFGGWKRSLFGDHYMHGMEGVRFFTRLKTMTARWPGSIASSAEFAMPTLRER
jgi:malonate-semialdehyde dehydrogenase (acetylating)/methylmalonate-semialdehyde dehydrogenase